MDWMQSYDRYIHTETCDGLQAFPGYERGAGGVCGGGSDPAQEAQGAGGHQHTAGVPKVPEAQGMSMDCYHRIATSR